MSMTEIESELEKMTPDELRRLALESWSAFVAKQGGADAWRVGQSVPADRLSVAL
jgi:hypothetical protein